MSCLTPGGLPGTAGHKADRLRVEPSTLTTGQKSAEGMSRAGQPRLKARTMNDEGYPVKSRGKAADHRRPSAVTLSRDEPAAGERDRPESIPTSAWLERVLERTNLPGALKRVRSNQGATFASRGCLSMSYRSTSATPGWAFARNGWRARTARHRHGAWKCLSRMDASVCSAYRRCWTAS